MNFIEVITIINEVLVPLFYHSYREENYVHGYQIHDKEKEKLY